MTITGVHPYADKFPMLPEPELAELAESIRANGLRNPIVLTPDGLILDGRNRAAPESGGDCPDEARKRAVGPTWIARRWGSPSEAARRRGFRLRDQRPRPGRTPARRAHRIRVRDDSTPTATTWRLSGRQLHFRLRLASPDRGERATPVHDRAGAQDRTQLLPQEEQR